MEREWRRRDGCTTAGAFWGMGAGGVTSCVVTVWMVMGQGELLKNRIQPECWPLKGWRMDASLWSSIYHIYRYTVDVFTCTFSHITPRKFDLAASASMVVDSVESSGFRATLSWLWSDGFKRDRVSREVE